MLQQHSHMDRIGRLALLLVGIVLVLSTPALADTILSDGFESGDFNTNGWYITIVGAPANEWGIITTPVANGVYAAGSSNTGSSDYTILNINISTEGYAGINLSYNRNVVGFDSTDTWLVEWSDGTSWYTLFNSEGSSLNDGTGTFTYHEHNLPTEASNNPSFTVRFTCEMGAVSENCAIDDFLLTGALGGTNPIDPVPDGGYNYFIINGSKGYVIEVYGEYDANGTMLPVNKTLVPSNEGGYEYGVTTGLYEAHFKNLPSTTSSILIRRGIEIAYDPNGLYWDSTTDDDIIDANPNGAGDPDPERNNVFVYPDAYGTGISLEYHYLTDTLKEFIVINNRSLLGDPPGTVLAGENITLKHEFALHNINDAELWVDDTLWSENGVMNASKAEFRNGTETVFKLDTPIAYDSANHTVKGWYTFRRTLGDLWVEQHIPFSWLNDTETVYPVWIDPTTAIIVNSTLHIDLAEEEYNPLLEITLYNVTDDGIHSNTLYLDPIEDEAVGVENYAIDPTDVNFETGRVDVNTAQGEKLFKCTDYNITTTTCYGDWYEQQTITPGNNYTFNITAEDPGYYEWLPAIGESSTTSATYVPFTSKTFSINETGAYYVSYNTQQRSSVSNKNYAHRFLIDGTVVQQRDDRADSNVANEFYPTYGSFILMNFTAGTNHTASIEYSTQGGTTFMKGASFAIYDVNVEGQVQDYEYDADEAGAGLLTTPQTMTSITITPNVTSDWVVYASGSFSTGNKNQHARVRMIQDGTVLHTTLREDRDSGVFNGYSFAHIATLTAGNTYVFDVNITQLSSASGSYRRARLLAHPIDDMWDYGYAEQTIGSSFSTTSLSPVDVKSLNFTPVIGGEYFLKITGTRSTDNPADSAVNRVLFNGTQICLSPTSHTDSIDDPSYVCQSTYNLTANQTYPIIIQLNALYSNTVRAENMDIIIFRVTPDARFRCRPKLNQNWLIDRVVICDNVTRTTGTGSIIIQPPGSLRLINNAFIDYTGLTIQRWANPFMVLIERGSVFRGSH